MIGNEPDGRSQEGSQMKYSIKQQLIANVRRILENLSEDHTDAEIAREIVDTLERGGWLIGESP